MEAKITFNTRTAKRKNIEYKCILFFNNESIEFKLKQATMNILSPQIAMPVCK